MLSLQHATIPPNLLLDQLSERVRPFAKHVIIPTEAKSWPHLPENVPKRASVNSFGFGGTNAHAILENFIDPTAQPTNRNTDASSPLIPFNFSAASQTSLRAMLDGYAKFIRANAEVSLKDLSWTLNARRSTHPIRISLAASNPSDLADKLQRTTEDNTSISKLGSHGMDLAEPRFIGVFTGQGAQWAGMGANLIQSSSAVRHCLEKLQRSLDTLRQEHAPSWRLLDELIEPDAQRISQPVFSQTLCTAIQIAIVDLLRAARVNLVAVVGHSSGEIGASYAAGYLR